MPVDAIAREALEGVVERAEGVIREVRRIYIGSDDTVMILLAVLLAKGHALIEGVPGVAKTTLAKAFSATLGCTFRRIQFTPDLLPADITGTYVLDKTLQNFTLRQGPIFANLVLGDEINRAPAKTQSALLEAMQERQVTIEGVTCPLEAPFMVLATQNPVEHEGVYPLPEAQLDRFTVKLTMGYPSLMVESQILRTHDRPPSPATQVLTPEEIFHLQGLSDGVHVEEELYNYILNLVHFTRRHRHVELGASPRASLALLHVSKALALLRGRDHVLPDDVKLLAPFVLQHRLILKPEAEMDGVQAQEVASEALTAVRYAKGRS